MSFARPLVVGLALALTPVLTLPALADAPELQKRFDDGAPAKVADRDVDLGALKQFYSARGYRLAWSGASESKGDRLLMDLQTVALAEGLAPEAYAVPPTSSDLDHDLLVTDALLRLGHDLAVGRLSGSKAFGGFGPEQRPNFEAKAYLSDLAAGRDLPALAEALPPPYAGYQRLKLALEKYRQIARAGGWATIPDGPSIKPGQEDERVPLVRKRLIATGELAASHEKGRTLDAKVSEALRKFQSRHGLDIDGAVGRQTLAALNVTADERVRQIMVNLERWRWMPRTLAPLHIAVNLPAARLELVENGQVVKTMRVIVGDTKHPTPTMSASMTSVVLNPTWTVPPSITTKEILPKLKKDPNYLAANNMRFLDDGSRLRQQAGPDNALGQVKFNLRDSDDIYLHDTPKRQYFGRTSRALSHGCVRVERPVELAEAVLGEPWAGTRVADTIEESETRTVKIDRPLTVYLMYWTAWADGEGVVHFRDDLYGHDGRVKAALKRLRPSSASQVAEESHRRPL
ncbi:MAG: L,D-transpeptidase family protein [Solirubrobacterales bacterium]